MSSMFRVWLYKEIDDGPTHQCLGMNIRPLDRAAGCQEHVIEPDTQARYGEMQANYDMTDKSVPFEKYINI